MLELIKIRPDDEYNAEDFWTHMDEQFGGTAGMLRRKGEAHVTAETWARIRALPGFTGGPEYAPEALVVVEG